MKVTKIVREYIEESVGKKFQPAIDALKEKYALGEAAETERAVMKRIKTAAKALYTEVMGPYYTAENMETLMNGWSICSPCSYRVRPIAEREYDEESAALKRRRDDTIKNILITLELGGTKADLDRMLTEVNVDDGDVID